MLEENENGLQTFHDENPIATQDRQRAYRQKIAVHLILGSILFESIAFYSLTDSLGSTLRLTKTLNWTAPYTSHASYIFSGTEFLSMLLFAVLTDGKFSRGKTIFLGFPIYIIGFTLLTIIANGHMSSCPVFNTHLYNITSIIDEHCANRILPILIFTALGAGMVRCNLIAFGADQIPDSKRASHYIDKFVIIINLASIIETLFDAYIPHQTNYSTVFLTSNSILLISSLLFLVGWKYYIHAIPYDSSIGICFSVYRNAFQTWLKHPRTEIIREDQQIETFLDFARVQNNSKFQDRYVDDLYTTFIQQSATMKNTSPKINDLILLGEPVTIVIGVFILNIFVYKYLRARNRSLTIATKFILSMFFAFFNMSLAGGVELWRQYECHNHNTSNLTVFIQLPQYIGMGLAQLFGLLASFEFAYFYGPRSARALFMSLHFVSRGIASFIGVGYTTLLRKYSFDMYFYCPIKTAHREHYYTYFFVLAGIQLIFTVIFIVCQKTYQIIKLNRQRERARRFEQSFTGSID